MRAQRTSHYFDDPKIKRKLDAIAKRLKLPVTWVMNRALEHAVACPEFLDGKKGGRGK